MGNFHLSEDSLADLENIWSYIAMDNPDAADRVIEFIHRDCRLLAESPKLGPVRRLGNNLTEIRSIVVTAFPDYIIYYHPTFEGVQILRVLHDARDQARLFGDSEKE